MRRALILLVGMAVAAAACGGGDGAVTTTVAPSSTTGAASTTAVTTTTAAPATTTTLPPTTTTTTLPPPEVAWGRPQGIVAIPSGFFTEEGDISSARVEVIASWADSAYLFVAVDLYGRGRNLGGVMQTDAYSDVGVWFSPDGLEWTAQAGPAFPGFFDEWANAAVPFGDELVVVGAWRESGTIATEVPFQGQSVWTFSNEPLDGVVWVGKGNPPAWERRDDPDLGGDSEETMLGVAEVGGVLVAVGESRVLPTFGTFTPGDYDGAVWVSADGRDWQRVADPGGLFSGPGMETTLEAVVGDGVTAWAFGIEHRSSSTGLAVWTTTDGTIWERVEATGDGITSNQGLVVGDVARSAAGMVVVGNEFGSAGRFPAAWFSADGVSWERVDLGLAVEGELVAVTATEFGFIAVGHTRPDGALRPLVLLSGDGRIWYHDTGDAFEVEGAARAALTAVGVHEGLAVVAGVVTYTNDVGEVMVWSGPVGPTGG